MRRFLRIGHKFISSTLEVRNRKFDAHISCIHDVTGTQVYDLKESLAPDEVKENHVPIFQISHPWPQWLDLMQCLLKRGYFDADGNAFENKEFGPKDSNLIRSACLKFGRDRPSLVSLLSRKDIKVIVGCGCPSIDRKVVNSAKRLRAHVGLDELIVCGTCHLRGNCERAYVKVREDKCGRTVDIMRLLLTYGLDPLVHSVDNKACQNKIVRESVKTLLKEVVDFSTKEPESDPLDDVKAVLQENNDNEATIKQGEWNCPKCKFLNFARNLRCLRCDYLCEEKLKHFREDQDHLPLKKGDWLCVKCNFLNFAKNTKCLRCKEKPQNRQINPGEWECTSCNYINFRKNMICLKCDHKRPKAPNTCTAIQPPPKAPNTCTAIQPPPENSDESRLGGVTNESTTSTNQNKGLKKWKFVEDEVENIRNSIYREEEDCRFSDFPIKGGKSSLSRNTKGLEKWKLEMREKKRDVKTGENCDQIITKYTQRRLKILGSSDDEEMADWFGH